MHKQVKYESIYAFNSINRSAIIAIIWLQFPKVSSFAASSLSLAQWFGYLMVPVISQMSCAFLFLSGKESTSIGSKCQI